MKIREMIIEALIRQLGNARTERWTFFFCLGHPLEASNVPGGNEALELDK